MEHTCCQKLTPDPCQTRNQQDSLRLVYCLVGTNADCVKKVVRDVSINLMTIQASSNTLELEKPSQINLTKLQVGGRGLFVGYRERTHAISVILLICIACCKVNTNVIAYL